MGKKSGPRTAGKGVQPLVGESKDNLFFNLLCGHQGVM